MGLAGLGLKVALAFPCPSGEQNRPYVAQDEPGRRGGTLTHYDHPAQGEELLSWFVRA